MEETNWSTCSLGSACLSQSIGVQAKRRRRQNKTDGRTNHRHCRCRHRMSSNYVHTHTHVSRIRFHLLWEQMTTTSTMPRFDFIFHISFMCGDGGGGDDVNGDSGEQERPRQSHRNVCESGWRRRGISTKAGVWKWKKEESEREMRIIWKLQIADIIFFTRAHTFQTYN